jgi:SAM-dependent methyltransferase
LFLKGPGQVVNGRQTQFGRAAQFGYDAGMGSHLSPLSRVWTLCALTLLSSLALSAAETAAGYRSGPQTRDGLGKYYFGREIAQFMTHEGAPWLERPEREQEERPDLVLKALALKPGGLVADVGCGTGYYSWRMAQAVGPKGKVYGVEIQREMLDQLAAAMKARKIDNVIGILGAVDDPKLPEPVDLVIMVDVYHECSQPAEMMAAICRQLKPGGRMVFVEYRGEDPTVPIKPLHKMTEAQVKREMSAMPLQYVTTVRSLPWQHVIIFRKVAPAVNANARKF